MLKLIDLLQYNYRYINENGFCHTFGSPKQLTEEEHLLRLAELHIIEKNQVAEIQWNDDKSAIELTMKNGEKVVLGIA